MLFGIRRSGFSHLFLFLFLSSFAVNAEDREVSVLDAGPTQDAYGEKQVEGTAAYAIDKAEKKLRKKFDGGADFEAEIKEQLRLDQRGKTVEAIIDPNGKVRFLDGHHGNMTRLKLAALIYDARVARGTTAGTSREEFRESFLRDKSVLVNVRLMRRTSPSWALFAKAILERDQGYLTLEGAKLLEAKYPNIGLWRRPWSTLNETEKALLTSQVAEAFKEGDMPSTFLPTPGKTPLRNDDLRSLVGDVMRLRKIDGVDYENFVQFPMSELIRERTAYDPELARILNLPYKDRLTEMMRYLYETAQGHEILLSLADRMRGDRALPAVISWVGSFYEHVVDSLKEMNAKLPVTEQLGKSVVEKLAREWVNSGVRPTLIEDKFLSQADRLGALHRSVQRKKMVSEAVRRGGGLAGLKRFACQFTALLVQGAGI